MRPHDRLGERIYSFIEDPVDGAILCPHDELEMGYYASGAALTCDNGHWIHYDDVRRGAN